MYITCPPPHAMAGTAQFHRGHLVVLERLVDALDAVRDGDGCLLRAGLFDSENKDMCLDKVFEYCKTFFKEINKKQGKDDWEITKRPGYLLYSDLLIQRHSTRQNQQ